MKINLERMDGRFQVRERSLENGRRKSTKKKLGIPSDLLRRQRYQVDTLGIIGRRPRRFSAGD
jgi:hypothetical protein